MATHVVIVNYPFDPACPTPEALLARFDALTGWVASVTATGARVTVIQRFHHDAVLTRDGARYTFVRDGARPVPRVATIPWRVHRHAVAARPDVVHFHGQIFPLQTRALRRALPRATPLIVQHHAGDPPTPSSPREWLWRALLRYGLAAADGFLFTADDLAQPWREAEIIAPHQPVYTAIEASTTLRPPEGGPPQHLPGDPALLWVGRLHPIKDPLTVLEGLARALPALPGAALTMAYGSEELLDAVRERSARPDLAGRVTLLGRVPHAELPAYYTAADLFVLGSRREGSGFALIEALACGLTPVVTDIPAFRAVTGGIVGALWAPGDAEACAAALIRAAMNDRAAQRSAAHARFADALSWERVGQLAAAAYSDMVRRTCVAH